MSETENTPTKRFGCVHVVIILLLTLFLYLAFLAFLEWWNRPPVIDPRAARPDMICLSRARTIALQVILYAERYDGWMPSDPDYYVKLFGYPLNSETGLCGDPPGWYQPGAAVPCESQRAAADVTDFRCPLDPKPGLNSHGFPSSYRIAPDLVGRNIKDLAGQHSKLPVVIEIGPQHPMGRPEGPLGGVRIYGDFHGEIATPESSTRAPGDGL